MRNYHDMVTAKQPHDLVFSAGTIELLSLPQPTAIMLNFIPGRLLPLNYASHSFRIGAATTVAAIGQTPSLIKTLERWSSNAYMTYIHCPKVSLLQYHNNCQRH